MRATVSLFLTLTLCAAMLDAGAAFVDNGDGTVTDQASTLIWQQCTAPASGTDCGMGTPTTYVWDDALGYCNDLTLDSYDDWRLPNAKELHSLVDFTKTSSPSINTSHFPGTPSADFWASTTLAGTPSYAWYVSFSVGLTVTSGVSKGNGLYVRCVRGG